MLTFIDWFAGIGGFRRGMELARHKCLGFCEYDKFAVKSYRAMHNTEGEWFANDIRTVRPGDIPRADVWCFGFPCQDISIAGKQLGFDGKRSSLFFTVTRLIRDTEQENRPTTLFIENVKNLLSVNGGIDFLKLLIELDEIGYDAEWQVLNSKDFGVPQNRERVFIVGHLRGRSGREIFPIREPNETIDIKVIGTTNPDRHSSADIHSSDGIMSTICGRDYKQPKQIAVKQIGNISAAECNPQSGRVYSGEGISPTLDTCTGGNRMPKIAVKEATKQGYSIAELGDSINLDQPNSETRIGRVGKGVAQTLTTSCNQAVLRPVRTDYGKEIRKDYEAGNIEISRHEFLQLEPRTDGITNTLSTVQKDNLLQDGFRIRKLTPLECFRLQGWSDDYFYKAAIVNSDSQLYKQAGNGVTVNVIYEIAKRLED